MSNYCMISKGGADKRTADEKKAAIEYIKKGFYSAGQPVDNPELLLSAILIQEGLVDPEVAALSDNLSVEQILDIIVEKTAYSGILEWEVSIRVRRDLATRQMMIDRGYHPGTDTGSTYKSFIIEGKVSSTQKIYASESTVLDAVRSIQRSVAAIYIRNHSTK